VTRRAYLACPSCGLSFRGPLTAGITHTRAVLRQWWTFRRETLGSALRRSLVIDRCPQCGCDVT